MLWRGVSCEKGKNSLDIEFAAQERLSSREKLLKSRDTSRNSRDNHIKSRNTCFFSRNSVSLILIPEAAIPVDQKKRLPCRQSL